MFTYIEILIEKDKIHSKNIEESKKRLGTTSISNNHKIKVSTESLSQNSTNLINILNSKLDQYENFPEILNSKKSNNLNTNNINQHNTSKQQPDLKVLASSSINNINSVVNQSCNNNYNNETNTECIKDSLDIFDIDFELFNEKNIDEAKSKLFNENAIQDKSDRRDRCLNNIPTNIVKNPLEEQICNAKGEEEQKTNQTKVPVETSTLIEDNSIINLLMDFKKLKGENELLKLKEILQSSSILDSNKTSKSEEKFQRPEENSNIEYKVKLELECPICVTIAMYIF